MDSHSSQIENHTFKLEKFEKMLNTLTSQMKEVQYVCFQDVDPTNRFQELEEKIYKIVILCSLKTVIVLEIREEPGHLNYYHGVKGFSEISRRSALPLPDLNEPH